MSAILEGKYRLLRTAGSGGTANVYLAEAAADGTRVAVKVMKKALSKSPEMLGRFEREAKLLQSVSNPHVIKLIELADSPQGLLLVMEWADGDRLDTIELPVPEVLMVLRQLASALAAIHGAGIVHRDFKPENVMVRREDGGVHCWLLDLGIARFRDPTQASGLFVTMAGQGAGTPSFLSPEQIRGELPDPRTDVYSFGVLAFRLMSGKLPFTGSNDFEVLHKQQHEKPPKLKVSDPRFEPFVKLVMKCLEKKREDRPADGEALLTSFEPEPSSSSPSSSLPKKRWWQRLS